MVCLQACHSEVAKEPESEHLVSFTSENFKQQVIDNKQLVLVDFWAPWCAPCLAIDPVVSALADKYAGRVTIGKMNVDDYWDFVEEEKYIDTGIPTIKFFKGGKMVENVLGLVSEKELIPKIEKHL